VVRFMGGVMVSAPLLSAGPWASAAEPRAAVPSAEQIARSQSRVREVFAEDLEAAGASVEKAEVAGRLAEQACITTDPNDRFCLAIVGSQQGDRSWRRVGRDRVDRPHSRTVRPRVVVVETRGGDGLAARAGQGAAGEVAALCLAISRDAMNWGGDNVAARAVGLAAGVARKIKDPYLVAWAARLQLRLKQRQAVDREPRPLLDAAAANASDADANTATGKVLLLKAERRAEGLPMLTKGADDPLRGIALAELRPGDVPARRGALGDARSERSETQKVPWKAAARARVAFHCERVVSSLSGSEQARMEKRLAAASRQSGGTGQTVFLADLPEKSATGQTMFFKDGQCFGKPFAAGGKAFPKSIAALPNAEAFSTVAYAIPPGKLRSRGRVGIFTPAAAKPGEKPASSLAFQVVIDGDMAWRSPSLQKLGDSAGFDVHLEGGRVLELQTAVGDPDRCSWGAWLDSVLVS
jgi:hypothetical protein